MPGDSLSLFDRMRIIILYEAGHSHSEIALSLGRVRSTVTRTIQRYRETGQVESRPRSGRPRVTSARENRYMVQYARRNRSSTVTALRFQFQATYHRVISNATVRRRIISAGLRQRRPLRVPLLQARHRAARLEWARERQNWLLREWRNVLFSDETRFALLSDDNRIRVWRERGNQQRLSTAVERLPFQGGSEMFWGGIMFGRRTPLIHIPQTMTGNFYENNIIRPIIYPLRAEFGENFIFMDDNARPHRTRRVQEVLTEGHVERMNWPAYSADMNPIEHIWDYIGRAIRRRQNPPRVRAEIIVAATEEWDNMPQYIIDSLIRGMYRRIHALIQSRGGNTLY